MTGPQKLLEETIQACCDAITFIFLALFRAFFLFFFIFSQFFLTNNVVVVLIFGLKIMPSLAPLFTDACLSWMMDRDDIDPSMNYIFSIIIFTFCFRLDTFWIHLKYIKASNCNVHQVLFEEIYSIFGDNFKIFLYYVRESIYQKKTNLKIHLLRLFEF